jgi:murein DD-endopeptidase MepM/ murein hydrolase activator NlpD
MMIDRGATAAALSQLGFKEGLPSRPPGVPIPPPRPPTFTLGPAFSSFGQDTAFGPNPSLVGGSLFGPREGLAGRDPHGLADTHTQILEGQARYEQRMAEQIAAFGGTAPPSAPIPGDGGSMASLGGNWANVDRWNSFISEASSKYGIPANLLKAVMMLESGGDPSSGSPQGATGLMQIMPFWDGTAGYSIHDPRQNVLLGAHILKDSYSRWSGRANDPWQEAVKDYIGRGGPDAFGTTAETYWPRIQQYWNELNAGTQSSVGGGSFPGGTASIQTIFPAGALYDWGEFNAPSGNGLYGYGTQYGLNGSSHTGLDVAMDVGSAYRAPMGGTVMCSGTGRGQGADGGGCSAFNDYFGQGAGRVEVLLDNGAVLIYGHSSTSALQPGQRFGAGQVLGTSGGMNSAHIHLEARVRDASMPSGWRIVDPRQVMGGGQMPGGSGTGNYTSPVGGGYSSGPTSFVDFWRNFYNK